MFLEVEADAGDDIMQPESELIFPEPILQHIGVRIEPVISELLEDGVIGKENESALKQTDI
jgi:hypothetical protein